MATQNFYRAFEEFFQHPKLYKQITFEEFEGLKKQKMESGKGIIPKHKKTNIYFIDTSENHRYIVEIILDNGTYYVETPCTYTPSMGMDSIDGNFAQDAEEWILEQNTDYKSERIAAIFGEKDQIYFNDYLKLIGFPYANQELDSQTSQVVKKSKKVWWKFW